MLRGLRGRQEGRGCSRWQWILGTSPRITTLVDLGRPLQASVMTEVKVSLHDRPSSYGRNLQLLVADCHHIGDCLAH